MNAVERSGQKVLTAPRYGANFGLLLLAAFSSSLRHVLSPYDLIIINYVVWFVKNVFLIFYIVEMSDAGFEPATSSV